MEFLPIVERVSLLIGNFNCCSFDTVKFNVLVNNEAAT